MSQPPRPMGWSEIDDLDLGEDEDGMSRSNGPRGEKNLEDRSNREARPQE